MQQQAVNAEKALRSVKLQLTSRTREKRLIELTRAELQTVPDDGRGGLYNGVGKMCVISNHPTKLTEDRFMAVERPTLMDDLSKQERSISEDIAALEKKGKYMQKELESATANLKDVFQSRS